MILFSVIMFKHGKYSTQKDAISEAIMQRWSVGYRKVYK